MWTDALSSHRWAGTVQIARFAKGAGSDPGPFAPSAPYSSLCVGVPILSTSSCLLRIAPLPVPGHRRPGTLPYSSMAVLHSAPASPAGAYLFRQVISPARFRPRTGWAAIPAHTPTAERLVRSAGYASPGDALTPLSDCGAGRDRLNTLGVLRLETSLLRHRCDATEKS